MEQNEQKLDARLQGRYEKAITQAKLAVAKAYAPAAPQEQLEFRRWVRARAPCAYDNPAYDMELIMFSGSPAKGHIIVNYGHGTVSAYDAWNKHIHTWTLEFPFN